MSVHGKDAFICPLDHRQVCCRIGLPWSARRLGASPAPNPRLLAQLLASKPLIGARLLGMGMRKITMNQASAAVTAHRQSKSHKSDRIAVATTASAHVSASNTQPKLTTATVTPIIIARGHAAVLG